MKKWITLMLLFFLTPFFALAEEVLVEKHLAMQISRVQDGFAGAIYLEDQRVSFFSYRDDGYITVHGRLNKDQLFDFIERMASDRPNDFEPVGLLAVHEANLTDGIGQPADPDKPWLEPNGFYANDSWVTSDKLAHLLGCYVLSVRLRESEWVNFLSGGNKWVAALEAFTCGALWEYKDYRYSWESYGYWGGDGFSYRDLVADFLGCFYSLNLLDPATKKTVSVVKKFDEMVVARVVRFVITPDSLKDQAELKKAKPENYGVFWVDKDVFWSRISRFVIYDGLIVATAATVNLIKDGEPFPNGTKWTYDSNPRDGGVPYNQEISWIFGIFGQSMVQDCASDEIGFIVGECFIVINEAQNATFSAHDVPYLGDKIAGGGWNEVQVYQASVINLSWYGLRKVSKLVRGKPLFRYDQQAIKLSLGLTPGGFGIESRSAKIHTWLAPNSNGINIGIRFDLQNLMP